MKIIRLVGFVSIGLTAAVATAESTSRTYYGEQPAVRNLSCTPLATDERQAFVRTYGTDLVDVVQKTLVPLHRTIAKVDLTTRLVAANFQATNWAQSLFPGPQNTSSLAPAQANRLNVISAILLAYRYRDLVMSNIPLEQKGLGQLRPYLDPEDIAAIAATPIEPMVRAIRLISCDSPIVDGVDTSQLYGCKKGEILFEVMAQLTPHLACYCDALKKNLGENFCTDFRNNSDYQIYYYFRTHPGGGFDLVDFGQSGARMALSTFAELRSKPFDTIIQKIGQFVSAPNVPMASISTQKQAENLRK